MPPNLETQIIALLTELKGAVESLGDNVRKNKHAIFGNGNIEGSLKWAIAKLSNKVSDLELQVHALQEQLQEWVLSGGGKCELIDYRAMTLKEWFIRASLKGSWPTAMCALGVALAWMFKPQIIVILQRRLGG